MSRDASTAPDRNLLLHGSTEPMPERIPLRAGPLEMVFEAGDLRYVSRGGREAVRRIYGAVRDREWNTIPGVLSEVALDVQPDHFRVTYRSDHRDGAIDFWWRCEIIGRSDGTVVFGFSGEAASTFERNRIGLCVLHPMRECAGLAARLRRAAGGLAEVSFPRLVAIEQPIAGFHDLAGLTYDVGTGPIELEFAGDTFETEDQRNWIDASFKTYGTPLGLPRPVLVGRGTRIEQRVTVRPAGPDRPSARAPVSAAGAAPTPDGDGPVALPAVGVGIDGGGRNPVDAELLSRLRPAHLRIDLTLWRSGWAGELAHALDLAQVVGSELELVVDVDPQAPGDVVELAARLSDAQPIARVLVHARGRPVTTREALDLVRSRLGGGRQGSVRIGAASRADLYELHLFPPPPADVLAWPMNPHAHASDVTSLAETPPAAEEQVRSVGHRHRAAQIAVSAVTLRPRVRTPRAAQPLQASLFGAAWTLAMAAHIARGGAASATFYEGTHDLRTAAGDPCPLAHVIADLCECAGGTVHRLALTADRTDGSTPGPASTCASLLIEIGPAAVLLVANLTPHQRRIQLPAGFEPAVRRALDAATAPRAAADWAAFRGERTPLHGMALDLAPFATARVDGRMVRPR